MTYAPRSVLLIGEALIDIVTRGDSSEEFVGGSPANAAIGVARLGHSSRLLTRVGDDPRGARIAAHLAGENVELLPESRTPEATSTALATIGEDGAAEYVFDIDWRVPAFDAGEVALVHAGSIGLFLEPGGAEVLRVLGELKSAALVTIDPNIRASLLPDHATALRRFEDAAALADLVKLSDEDAEWLYPGQPIESVAEHVLALGPAITVITRGAEGSLALNRDGLVRIPAKPVDVVDTISAGDSVMASLISSLLERGVELSSAELTEVLDRAARAAAIAVSVAGANPPYRAALDGS